MIIAYLLQNILLGAGLAMDAFSVSIANGISDPDGAKRKTFLIAFTFGGFQFLMPLLGWTGVNFVAHAFSAFVPAIPWIALFLLSYIGIKMIIDSIKDSADEDSPVNTGLTMGVLLIQGVATSIDALSTGFAIASYDLKKAFFASLIIGLVTFIICIFGVRLGKKFGLILARRASIVGGLILIFIGLEIFVKSFL